MGRKHPIYQFDWEGVLIGEYSSVSEASKATGVSPGTLIRHAKVLSPKGRGVDVRLWSLEHLWSFSRVLDQEALKRLKCSLRMVYQFDMSGELVAVYSGPKEAGEENGLDGRKLSYHLLKRGTYKEGEYEYSYTMDRVQYAARDYRFPVRAIDSDGNIMVFESQCQAADTLGIIRGNIRRALDKPSSTYYGYRWESVKEGK